MDQKRLRTIALHDESNVEFIDMLKNPNNLMASWIIDATFFFTVYVVEVMVNVEPLKELNPLSCL